MPTILEWQYPLYKPVDRAMFRIITKAASKSSRMVVLGLRNDYDVFLKLLIVSSKAKDWRAFIEPVVRAIQKSELNLPSLIAIGRKLHIRKGVDRSWAVFKQDQRLCLLLDRFRVKKIRYSGTKKEFVEFILRFLLSELLQDWRGPKMMVVIESLKGKSISMRRLNRLLRQWDFTGVFK